MGGKKKVSKILKIPNSRKGQEVPQKFTWAQRKSANLNHGKFELAIRCKTSKNTKVFPKCHS